MSDANNAQPHGDESPTAGATGIDNSGHQIVGTVERIAVSARIADVHVMVDAAGAGDTDVEAAGSIGRAQTTLVFLAVGDAAEGSFADRFSVEHEGGHLSIDEAEGGWPDGTLSISLSQPSASARIRTRSGAVAVSGLEGNLAVRSRNGAISVRHCIGNLKLMCANGSIELAHCSAGYVELSSSNGRISVGDTELGGGTVKTANGRIRMQLRPYSVVDGGNADAEDVGRLAIYSANGGISLGVPDETSMLFKIRSLGRVKNDLPVRSVQSSAGMTVIKTGSDEPQEQPFVVLIKNLKGRIELMRYVHLDAHAKERRSDDVDGDDEFFEEGYPHGVWFDVDFSEELPKFMDDVKRFGDRFGNLGEEISREMRNAFMFGRRQHQGERQDAQQQHQDTSAEVASVLEMFKEGKITVEEAETLIAAIRR